MKMFHNLEARFLYKKVYKMFMYLNLLGSARKKILIAYVDLSRGVIHLNLNLAFIGSVFSFCKQ